MKRSRPPVLTFLLLVVPAVQSAGVDFNRHVRPILSGKCFQCHGPDAAPRQAGLRLDIESAAKGMTSAGRAAIVPGDPAASELVRRIASTNPATRMPPAFAGKEKLTAPEIDLLRRWIEEGAPWKGHWSFEPPRRPALPTVRNQSWPRNPIDRFVLARLEREELSPSPEAARTTLARRLALDLTGLPPPLADLDRFLRDSSPAAYEKLVDRLLASPRHSERLAMRWLDAARYADTNGYQTDGERSMWRWRDWVIQAFSSNMPFDRFTIEQIAGDLLPAATLDQTIASAFHRNHRTNAEGGIVDEEFRVEYVADRVETTATVWLGLTIGCARCHDHKYDPISQKDYYRLFAYFNRVPERGLVYNWGNDDPIVKAPTPDQQRRLQQLDRLLSDAGKKWLGTRNKLAREQTRWEKHVAQSPGFDWTVTEGQVLHKSLAGAESRFDGRRSVDAGDVANFSFLDPFTVAAWIQPASPDGAIATRTEEWLEGEGYGVYLINGKVRLHITKRWTDISLRVETESALPMNRRRHVAVTYDGRRKAVGVAIYIDGRRQPLKVLFDELNWPIGVKEPFRIGAGGGPRWRFRGRIDEVRVYNKALTADQVGALSVTRHVSELARLAPETRTEAQAAKLRLCFLDRFASGKIRRARSGYQQAAADRDRFHDSIPTVMVMRDDPKPRDTFVLKRGAYDNPGEKVGAGVPSALPPLKPEWSPDRLGLARWLVDRSNPLTARVIVNRYWQMLFGTGLVKTVEDFGAQGDWPADPLLLDWLASEFIDSGWNLRALIKTIVMSAAYRQSSVVSKLLLDKDPENRLLARGARFRLPAETIRDQALAVSGLLVERTGGPSVRPYQPPGLWEELAGGKGYKPDLGEGLYRRGLYTYWKRTVAPPAMMLFDAPNRETCWVRETRTNTPLQALNLMNDVTYLEAARKMAERMFDQGGRAPAERIAYGFRLVLARPPRPAEIDALLRARERFLSHYRANPSAAAEFLTHGESPSARHDRVELAALSGVASLILNLDEAITRE